MKGERLKCRISVTAGLVPDVPTEEFSRAWHLTEPDISHPTAYFDAVGAAMHYASILQDPHRFNWVKTEWIWY